MAQKTYRNESEFSVEVVRFFRAKLNAGRLTGIHVEERLKILKDLTIGKDREGQWRLVAGFQQQDIVFFAPSDCINMDDFMSPVMRIDKYDRTGATPVTIPLVVCELKLGSAMNTHNIITYASISTQLKSIFPHCAYYFVMDSSRLRHINPETVLRHSKSFDRVFLDWETEKEKVWEAIRAHLEYLGERGLLPVGLAQQSS